MEYCTIKLHPFVGSGMSASETSSASSDSERLVTIRGALGLSSKAYTFEPNNSVDTLETENTSEGKTMIIPLSRNTKLKKLTSGCHLTDHEIREECSNKGENQALLQKRICVICADWVNCSRPWNMVTVWSSLPILTNHNLSYPNKRILLLMTGFLRSLWVKKIVAYCNVFFFFYLFDLCSQQFLTFNLQYWFFLPFELQTRTYDFFDLNPHPVLLFTSGWNDQRPYIQIWLPDSRWHFYLELP